jgi:hypothetical protein
MKGGVGEGGYDGRVGLYFPFKTKIRGASTITREKKKMQLCLGLWGRGLFEWRAVNACRFLSQPYSIQRTSQPIHHNINH